MAPYTVYLQQPKCMWSSVQSLLNFDFVLQHPSRNASAIFMWQDCNRWNRGSVSTALRCSILNVSESVLAYLSSYSNTTVWLTYRLEHILHHSKRALYDSSVCNNTWSHTRLQWVCVVLSECTIFKKYIFYVNKIPSSHVPKDTHSAVEGAVFLAEFSRPRQRN